MIPRIWPNVSESNLYPFFSQFGFVVFGFLGTFIALSLSLDIIKLIISTFFILTEPRDSYYILFVQIFKNLQIIILVASVLMTTFGYFQAIQGPQIKEIKITKSTLPSGLEDFKIIQISDLHISTGIGHKYVQNIIQKTNAENPDIVVLTGDIIDGPVESMASVIEDLNQIKAKYGVYFITGNHEYYWNIEKILATLSKTNIKTLINENIVLNINKSKLLISGLADSQSATIYPPHTPNLNSTILAKTEADFKVLLNHRPEQFIEAEKNNYDLQLSGHTHSGQFFPFNLVVPFAHKYYRGLSKYGNLHIYVNTGTGYWGPANRFAVPSEITLLTLSQK